MLHQYTEHKKKSVWPVLKKLVFLIPVGIILYMFHLDSREMRQYLDKVEKEKETLLQSFDVYVFQSGYQKKRAGFQEIYIPTLVVRVTNLTDREFNNLRFDAYFQRDGRTFCRGAASLFRLKPLETKDVYLRCMDSVVFGTVISGLRLMETTDDIRYKVSIYHEKKHVTAAEGSIEFNLLFP
jgi:hypothetical protein